MLDAYMGFMVGDRVRGQSTGKMATVEFVYHDGIVVTYDGGRRSGVMGMPNFDLIERKEKPMKKNFGAWMRKMENSHVD